MQKSQVVEENVVKAVKDFAYSITSGSKVVADMSSLIDVTSQLPLTSFDYWERFIRTEFSLALREREPPKWKFWSKPKERLTWLDLISWDGYKREKALRTLRGAAPNTFFFSLAVRRLNDWVPQVRDAARESLPELAKVTAPDFVIDSLLIALSNWNSWGRIEDADKKILLLIISQKEIANSMRSRLISSSSGPMPFLFSQLGRTNILDDYLPEIANLAVQPAVRAKAYRSLLERRIAWVEGYKWIWTDIRYCEGRKTPIVAERKLETKVPVLRLLECAAEDRSSVVRKVSAEVLIRDLEGAGVYAKELAEKFSLDQSSAVSERGRFALSKLRELERDNSS
ncbi:hypothetical protein [Thaumasiovibrio subtropicus]|uniref:hypothetical protein n=1 Tax=Thaumasiovibrio subtropicus TaxID=1891207 RepID=UPI000B3561B1|nr:hypothetical protein [Thaumasiovibrio subtropicus]